MTAGSRSYFNLQFGGQGSATPAGLRSYFGWWYGGYEGNTPIVAGFKSYGPFWRMGGGVAGPSPAFKTFWSGRSTEVVSNA